MKQYIEQAVCGERSVKGLTGRTNKWVRGQENNVMKNFFKGKVLRKRV
jgi:hypothetical protein